MNKVIRKHYPASKLPAELRGDIPDSELVEVHIVREAQKKKALKELLELAESLPKSNLTPQDAVRQIRKLRDEWDD